VGRPLNSGAGSPTFDRRNLLPGAVPVVVIAAAPGIWPTAGRRAPARPGGRPQDRKRCRERLHGSGCHEICSWNPQASAPGRSSPGAAASKPDCGNCHRRLCSTTAKAMSPWNPTPVVTQEGPGVRFVVSPRRLTAQNKHKQRALEDSLMSRTSGSCLDTWMGREAHEHSQGAPLRAPDQQGRAASRGTGTTC